MKDISHKRGEWFGRGDMGGGFQQNSGVQKNVERTRGSYLLEHQTEFPPVVLPFDFSERRKDPAKAFQHWDDVVFADCIWCTQK